MANTIQIDNQEVLDAFNRLIASVEDMTPVMANVAQALESETERQFASESGPFGAWPELAPSTIKERTASGTWPGKMLQRSAGGLAASVFSNYGRDFAEIGSNKPYAAIHHFGGQAGRGLKTTIPARPYFPFDPIGLTFSKESEMTILDVFEGYLSGSLS